MKVALAAALLALSVTAAQARPPVCNDHMCAEVAWGGMARDVVEAVRQKRALVRKSHPRRHMGSVVGGRPSGCPPRAWCGCFLGHFLGMPRRTLWLARNWASVGRNAGGPGVGVIVVWRHHVGIITGRRGSQWVVKSGNDSHAVRERPRSLARAIAYRVAS